MGRNSSGWNPASCGSWKFVRAVTPVCVTEDRSGPVTGVMV